jgi:RNA polymerase sigma-70 factor (ECF subfamily)
MEIAAQIGKADVLRPMTGEAFDAFVEARRERAVRVAYRMLAGDLAAAEDVAQNAFMRAHRALAGFRGDASVDTWFYRILVREVQRYRRWRAVRQLFSADAATAPPALDERALGDPGLRRRIGDALSSLSPTQREVFVLIHLEEFTVVETAALLGKAVGTVKSHLHRALESLRLDLADLRKQEPAS